MTSFGVDPCYASIHRMITNPIYGGAYAYGKTGVVASYDGIRSRQEPPEATRGVAGVAARRTRGLSRLGAIGDDSRRMVSDNIPSSRHHGAAKHGDALLAEPAAMSSLRAQLTLRYTGASTIFPLHVQSWLARSCRASLRTFGGLRVDDATGWRSHSRCSNPARSRRRSKPSGKRPSNVTKCVLMP